MEGGLWPFYFLRGKIKVFSDQLDPERERRNQSLTGKKQTYTSIQEMPNIYTFTENAFLIVSVQFSIVSLKNCI